VLVVSADVYRPGAIKQLEALAKQAEAAGLKPPPGLGGMGGLPGLGGGLPGLGGAKLPGLGGLPGLPKKK